MIKVETTDKLVVQSNKLYDNKIKGLTLGEARLLAKYLSLIDPHDKSTSRQEIPIRDFQKIMGVKRVYKRDMKKVFERLTEKAIHEEDPEDENYLLTFGVFKYAKLFKTEWGDLRVELDANELALPYLFRLRHYFKYGLGNIIRLKSSVQIKLYELLKRWEWQSVGVRMEKIEFPVPLLREKLGIEKHEYSGRTGWSNFRKWVLDACQKSFAENTDICFTYERGRVGNGGKWLSVVFRVYENKEYIDQLGIGEYFDDLIVGEEFVPYKQACTGRRKLWTQV